MTYVYNNILNKFSFEHYNLPDQTSFYILGCQDVSNKKHSASKQDRALPPPTSSYMSSALKSKACSEYFVKKFSAAKPLVRQGSHYEIKNLLIGYEHSNVLYTYTVKGKHTFNSYVIN